MELVSFAGPTAAVASGFDGAVLMSEANHHQKQQRHAAKGHDLETVTGQRQVKEQVLRADAARISLFAL